MDIYNLISKNHNNKLDLDNLLERYYSIDNYTFTNDNMLDEHIIDNFKHINNDIIIDKFQSNTNLNLNLNNYNSNISNGVILFDLSMSNDEQLYSNINNIMNNYSNINLHKFSDNYVMEFSNKKDTLTNLSYTNDLKNIFANDLNNLLLCQRIQNIPYRISNEDFNSKIKEDLQYLDILNKSSYTSIISENDLDLYKKSIDINLKSNEYKVSYIFDKTYNKLTIGNEHFEKLKEFNTYIDDISMQINNIQNIQNNLNKFDKFDGFDGLYIDNLFDINLLDKLYQNNQNINSIEMNDVLDKNFKINKLSISNQIDNNTFFNNIFKFLNELIKRKFIKIIKLNNILQLSYNNV